MCSAISTLCFALWALCDVGMIIQANIEIDSNVAAWKQKYNSMMYQLENDMYIENNVGLRDLINEVEYWNYDLARRKELANNFWVGIYYPDVYEQFEFIDLSEYNLEGLEVKQ